MLIAIEGIDGSGKGTQARQLVDRLVSEDIATALLSFPRYDDTLFGTLIGEYLNARYGSLEQVHPLLASLLFAGDRFESLPVLEQALQDNAVVVLDRYVASNVAHQGARASEDEQRRLMETIQQIEYEVHGLPRADLTILLDLPAACAVELIARKNPRTYTDQSADLHEADSDYLESVRAAYRQLAEDGPSWRVVSVLADGDVRSIEDIAGEILAFVRDALPG